MGKLIDAIQNRKPQNEKYTGKAFEHLDYMDKTLQVYDDEDICSIWAIKPLAGGAPNVFVFTQTKVHTFINKKYYVSENAKVVIKPGHVPGSISLIVPKVMMPRAAFEAYYLKPSPFFPGQASAPTALVDAITQIIRQNDSAGGFRIADHVSTLAAALKPNAKVLFAFAGQIIEWGANTSACAITDDGYLTIASAAMFTGKDVKKFKFSMIREFSVKNDVITNCVIMETLTEKLQVNVANANRAVSIYNKLTQLKEQLDTAQTQGSAAGAGSAADELLKYKNLLDIGAITQQEYDAKKKELLNL